MHPWHLRFVLVWLVLAIGSAQAGTLDPWYTITSPANELTASAMVDGGLENGRELFVCRAAYNNALLLGKTWPGLGGCFVSTAGEPLVTPYEVLAKPPLVSNDFVYRFATHAELNANPLVWNLAVQGGFGPGSSQDYRICARDLWVNGTYVGRHPGRFIGGPPQTNGTWCVVTWGGQVYYEDVDWSILIYNKLDLIQ